MASGKTLTWESKGLPFSSVHRQHSTNNTVLRGQTLLIHNSDYMVYILTASSKLALIKSSSKALTISHTTDIT